MRRGTPLAEIIDQCQGIAEMQPFFNTMPDGRSVAVLGLGNGIAHILKAHLKTREEREAAETMEYNPGTVVTSQGFLGDAERSPLSPPGVLQAIGLPYSSRSSGFRTLPRVFLGRAGAKSTDSGFLKLARRSRQ